MLKPTKELFVNSVRQIKIHDQAVVPTVVLYKEGKHFFGREAVENCDRPADLREDFKIEIGTDKPLNLAQRRVGSERSVLGIAKDFIDGMVSEAMSSIERQGYKRPSRILIAEPLSMSYAGSQHEDWLSNYRNSIRRTLQGKFEEIDFLPEPFAVFQYYRYGVRHALVAQKQKHVALVFDFGGGTFDASVIETTAAGDISQSGRNSKPLAARSIPVGGYAINRAIAEELLFKALEKTGDKPSVRKALEAYPTYKNLDDDALSVHQHEHTYFARNYRRLLRSVEGAKIAICSMIANWKLEANLVGGPAGQVEVPTRPLERQSPFVSLRLEASLIRSVYENRIWKQRLLPLIRETLKRASQELDGKPISIALLSGGSSNIRWLKPLIERDLSEQLGDVSILELSENFQEIVSKGLAVECARRFYTQGQGDFRAVTYNRLCLGLRANGGELELKKFDPVSPKIRDIATDAGVLLPSSTSLRGLIGQPLRWKVRLAKAPSQSLDYYFMRSSFDPDETDARQNLDSRVVTPKATKFASGIEVELSIREDGTAEPKFIYGHGSQRGQETVVVGKPFYLDMTSATEEAGEDTYLGFDFGTSTSSLCYVSASDIQTYAKRASDRTWLSLSALVDSVPYPCAYPLKRLLAETSADKMEYWGRESLESILTFMATIAYMEHCASGGQGSAFFKGYRQRSAGPLWALLKNCGRATGKKWIFGKELLELFESPFLDELDQVVSQVALPKHGKAASIDYPRILERVGNILMRLLEGKVFGYFEDARRKPFSMNTFTGLFRNAIGASPPFIDVLKYEGADDFPAEFLFLFDFERNAGLPLYPLMLRGLDRATGSSIGEPDFFVYDIVRSESVAFRSVQDGGEVVIRDGGPAFEVLQSVREILVKDLAVRIVSEISLVPRSEQ